MKSKLKNTLLALALGPFSLVFGGCEKPCKVPSGDYTMELKSLSGECPANVVAQFENFKDVVNVPDTQECKRFITAVDGEIPKTDCKMTMDISADATQNGLDDGQANFRIRCDDGFECKQLFQVAFTPKKGK